MEISGSDYLLIKKEDKAEMNCSKERLTMYITYDFTERLYFIPTLVFWFQTPEEPYHQFSIAFLNLELNFVWGDAAHSQS